MQNTATLGMRVWAQRYMSKKMLSIFLLGFSSGLPLALIISCLQARLKTDHTDNLVVLGSITSLTTAYAFKYLWAGVFDTYKLPFFSKRKGWILFFQILIFICILAMGLFDTSVKLFNFPVIISLAIILSFLGASQDIVIDAYRVESANQYDAGIGSSLAIEGYRVAMFISGSFSFVIADLYSWKVAYLVMAFFMLIGFIGTMLIDPSLEKKDKTNSQTEYVTCIKNNVFVQALQTFREFFKRDKAIYILLFITTYKLSDVFAHALITPFLVELKFSLTEIGLISKSMGTIATLCGVLFFGLITTRLSLVRSLFLFGILSSITNLIYYILTFTGKNIALASVGIILENLCAGMGTAAFVLLITQLSNKRYAALQFALLTSFAAFPRTYTGALAGYIANKYGWSDYFLLSSLAVFPSLLLLLVIKSELSSHKLTNENANKIEVENP